MFNASNILIERDSQSLRDERKEIFEGHKEMVFKGKLLKLKFEDDENEQREE